MICILYGCIVYYLLPMPMLGICTVDGYPHWKVSDYLLNWKTCDKADQRIPQLIPRPSRSCLTPEDHESTNRCLGGTSNKRTLSA